MSLLFIHDNEMCKGTDFDEEFRARKASPLNHVTLGWLGPTIFNYPSRLARSWKGVNLLHFALADSRHLRNRSGSHTDRKDGAWVLRLI
jgi:hypothetical protein